MMTKYLILFFLIFATSAFAQPRLSIEPGDTITWGKVKPIDSPLEAKIILRNTGNDSLYILKFKPGCGCTSSKLEKKNIEPGGFSNVDISVNLPNIPGRFHKIIDVKSTDPDNSERVIHLIADVVFPIIFIPQTQMISLPEMTTGKEYTGKISLINTTDEEIIIKEVKTFPDYLTTDLKSELILKPNLPVDINAKLTARGKGFFNGSIKFKTTHEDVPRIEIPVRGIVTQETDMRIPIQKP